MCKCGHPQTQHFQETMFCNLSARKKKGESVFLCRCMEFRDEDGEA